LTNDSHITLGVVAISYNEERDITRFIENIHSWVDEIVIIDDGSKDGTKSIASKYEKVKFIESPRQEGEYYSHQRNKGTDASSCEWLLHMDIDERVTPQLAKEILNAIQRAKYDAFKFYRSNYFLHRLMRGGGWSDWNQVHLAKRHVLKFGGMFHESIELKTDEEKVGQLNNVMVHLNDESFEERFNKSRNYHTEIKNRTRTKYNKVTSRQVIWSILREFVYKFFYKKGYKDGWLGALWAIHASTATFRAYASVWDEQNRIPRKVLEDQIKESWDQFKTKSS
jgi:(heptosyl)LPS beta-1,4-glucosyltransferase